VMFLSEIHSLASAFLASNALAVMCQMPATAGGQQDLRWIFWQAFYHPITFNRRFKRSTLAPSE
jgi:hypothetical protein